ncbi:MAG: hypothetical protein ACEQSH_00795 [Bacteroidia bacterium]
MTALIILAATMFALPFVAAWSDDRDSQRDHERRLAELEVERQRMAARGYQPLPRTDGAKPNPPPRKI